MSYKLQIGDKVRLSASALRRTHTLLEEETHDWATVIGSQPLIGKDCYELDRCLAGATFWCVPDILLLKKHTVKLPVMTRKPVKFMAGFIASNFSEPQAAAIKELEEATELVEQTPVSHKKPRREAKLRLNIAYQSCIAEGIEDALTRRELSIINLSR